MASPVRTVFVLLVLTTALPVTGSAEPFIIRSGQLSFDTGDPVGFGLSGDRFDLSGIFASIDRSPHQDCAPCPPGTVVNMTAAFGGEPRDFRLGQATTAVIDGTSFVMPGTRPPEIFGTFRFDAPTVTVPFSSDPTLFLTAPFTFSGTVTAPGLFALDLVGEGTAGLRLSSVPGPYSFSALAYTFADPIPEPGTLLLVGTGVGVLAAGRRRRSRRAGAATGPVSRLVVP